jgi:hypothetical protein
MSKSKIWKFVIVVTFICTIVWAYYSIIAECKSGGGHLVKTLHNTYECSAER